MFSATVNRMWMNNKCRCENLTSKPPRYKEPTMDIQPCVHESWTINYHGGWLSCYMRLVVQGSIHPLYFAKSGFNCQSRYNDIMHYLVVIRGLQREKKSSCLQKIFNVCFSELFVTMCIVNGVTTVRYSSSFCSAGFGRFAELLKL